MSAFWNRGFDANMDALTRKIGEIASPLEDAGDLTPLLDQIGGSRLVLLGEASHGTSQYYTWRARISRRLIQEKGFNFIAVEGDWPDCYNINRYVKGYDQCGDSAQEVLQVFERWPTWMWANWEVAALAEWMRGYNDTQPEDRQAGFYGLDVYSLWESMRSIIGYLDKTDPDSAKLARRALACFEPYGEDAQSYAWSTRMVPETCEDDVINLLRELRQNIKLFESDQEGAFVAEQNALVMVNAERYYRAMVRSDSNSWNVRDEHMMDTLDRLLQHHGAGSKGIVWAHNTHVGDARYTDMARAGMFNIGQLARQRYEDEGVVLVGFSSHRGSVIAGAGWGEPMQVMPVPEGQSGSWEDALHRAGAANKLLRFESVGEDEDLQVERGHRAIGVVYNPAYEGFGNYVPTIMPRRYDALLYIDQTDALHPMHIEPSGAEVPETYPWGL